ncbi:MAG: hypothetical protein WDN45_12070 [Caulobacteraceae bacterium]
MNHKLLTLTVFIGTAVLSAVLYATASTGFFPQQDTGFIQGSVITAQDSSYDSTNAKPPRWRGLSPPIRMWWRPITTSATISARPRQHRPAAARTGPQGFRGSDHGPPAAQAGSGGRCPDHPAGAAGHHHRRARAGGPYINTPSPIPT